jgi:two-component system, chemotaxis family, protein-glutamate methylesterase/glutaminase
MNALVKVLVVDDSAYNRRTITRMLEEIEGIEVIAYACDGEEGLRKVIDLKPDLITLDLEMPRMDGFTFLRIVMLKRPTPILVVSARSESADVFKALEFGAVEFVAKPSARISPELLNIQDDLVRKVRAIVGMDMNKILRRAPSVPVMPATPPLPAAMGLRRNTIRAHAVPQIAGANQAIRQVVIGASTGGPPALQAILAAIQQHLPVGIAIAQHMPSGFTKAFADRLNKFCAMEIREARSGDLMLPGTVLVAPGGKNLLLEKRGNDIVAQVADPLADQRYVPSADLLFESASKVFGSQLLGVVLTGMGNDGARGVVNINSHGGQSIAEAEETSVVFGMPKEAIATGLIDRVVPLPLMCGEILRRCGF